MPTPNLPPARNRSRTAASPPTNSRPEPGGGERIAAAISPAAQDEVGYCKPPKRHQFQPGQSGNPKGRPPKVQLSLTDMAIEELDKTVPARIGGRLVVISRRSAMIQRQIEKAMQGDLKAFVVLMRLDRPGTGAEGSALRSDPALSPEEAARLKRFLEMMDGDEPEVPS